jgi:hypothetical protein
MVFTMIVSSLLEQMYGPGASLALQVAPRVFGAHPDDPPYSCEATSADWNPVAASDPQSAYVSVLAGFVFVGITVVMSDRDRHHRTQALILFISSLVSLIGASLIYSTAAGEPACLRGWMGQMLANGPTATGTLGIFCGLAWLLSAYFGDEHVVPRFMTWIAHGATGIIIVIFAGVVRVYALDAARVDPDVAWLRPAAVWYALAALAVALAVRVLFARRARRSPALASDAFSRGLLAVCASVVVVTIITLALFGVLEDRPTPAWLEPNPFFPLVSAGWPVLSATIEMIALNALLPLAPLGVPAIFRRNVPRARGAGPNGSPPSDAPHLEQRDSR